jgi:hypothetical protein
MTVILDFCKKTNGNFRAPYLCAARFGDIGCLVTLVAPIMRPVRSALKAILSRQPHEKARVKLITVTLVESRDAELFKDDAGSLRPEYASIISRTGLDQR